MSESRHILGGEVGVARVTPEPGPDEHAAIVVALRLLRSRRPATDRAGVASPWVARARQESLRDSPWSRQAVAWSEPVEGRGAE